MINVLIDNKETPIESISYSIFHLDHNAVHGEHKYEIRIPIEDFVRRFKDSYEKERKEMDYSLIPSKMPSLNDLLKDQELIKKVLKNWYGYAVFDKVLNPNNPHWFILSFDNVRLTDKGISLEGTLTDNIKNYSTSSQLS
jgi:hypothetical protein